MPFFLQKFKFVIKFPFLKIIEIIDCKINIFTQAYDRELISSLLVSRGNYKFCTAISYR